MVSNLIEQGRTNYPNPMHPMVGCLFPLMVTACIVAAVVIYSWMMG